MYIKNFKVERIKRNKNIQLYYCCGQCGKEGIIITLHNNVWLRYTNAVLRLKLSTPQEKKFSQKYPKLYEMKCIADFTNIENFI